jgi:hypothetical protein
MLLLQRNRLNQQIVASSEQVHVKDRVVTSLSKTSKYSPLLLQLRTRVRSS